MYSEKTADEIMDYSTNTTAGITASDCQHKENLMVDEEQIRPGHWLMSVLCVSFD